MCIILVSYFLSFSLFIDKGTSMEKLSTFYSCKQSKLNYTPVFLPEQILQEGVSSTLQQIWKISLRILICFVCFSFVKIYSCFLFLQRHIYVISSFYLYNIFMEMEDKSYRINLKRSKKLNFFSFSYCEIESQWDFFFCSSEHLS